MTESADGVHKANRVDVGLHVIFCANAFVALISASATKRVFDITFFFAINYIDVVFPLLFHIRRLRVLNHGGHCHSACDVTPSVPISLEQRHRRHSMPPIVSVYYLDVSFISPSIE